MLLVNSGSGFTLWVFYGVNMMYMEVLGKSGHIFSSCDLAQLKFQHLTNNPILGNAIKSEIVGLHNF